MIFSIAQLQTGTGKTTSAIHLAEYAARQGRTVVIDDDERKANNNRALLPTLKQSERGAYTFDVVDGDTANITQLVNDYTTVIIDTEGNLSKDKLKLLARTQLVIIPANAKSTSLDSAAATARHLGEMYRILFVDVDAATYKQLHHEFATRHGHPVFSSYIPHSDSLPELMSKGFTAFDDFRDNKHVADAYAQVWREIVDEVQV